MIENRGLRRARGSQVVVAGDGMQQFGANTGIERGRPFLDHAKTEVHVTEQPALVCRTEYRLSLIHI